MKFCITRAVRDDFEALLMAEAMLKSGGEPFSVVIDPNPERSLRWCVYARFEATSSVDVVANEVDALFDGMRWRK